VLLKKLSPPAVQCRSLSTPAGPSGRQTLCFTATWPKSVRKLAAKFMRPAESGDLKRVFVEVREVNARACVAMRVWH